MIVYVNSNIPSSSLLKKAVQSSKSSSHLQPKISFYSHRQYYTNNKDLSIPSHRVRFFAAFAYSNMIGLILSHLAFADKIYDKLVFPKFE